MAVVIALLLVSGCAGADAALVDGECNQTDSTVSCCLKQNPGQYERCTATPSAQQPPTPNTKPPSTEPRPPLRPPPLVRVSEEDEEKQREFRKEPCQQHYERCVEKAGLKPNIQYGQSHCMACKEKCLRDGWWPWSANGKRCAGG
jgi:hypothetical protein